LLKTLSLGAKYSFKVAGVLIEGQMYRNIDQFIPKESESKEANSFPFTLEATQVLDSMLPENEEALTLIVVPLRKELENKKKEIVQGVSGAIEFIAENLL
jgi:hypothetical protein